MDAKIVLLPGDGIGPEIVTQGKRVLESIAARYGHTFSMPEHPIGGNAIDDFGDPLPQPTIDSCKDSDAILLGAVGGPKWDDPAAKTRPEVGLLKIRQELGLFANLRPINTFDEQATAGGSDHGTAFGQAGICRSTKRTHAPPQRSLSLRFRQEVQILLSQVMTGCVIS